MERRLSPLTRSGLAPGSSMALIDGILDPDRLRDEMIQVIDRATTNIRDIVLPEAHKHGTELATELGNVMRGVTDNMQAVLDHSIGELRGLLAELNTTLDKVNASVQTINGASIKLELPKL